MLQGLLWGNYEQVVANKVLLRSSKKFSKFDFSVWRMEKKDSRLLEE